MAGINKVILLGNLGKDPEVHTFEGGAKKVNFTLATTEYYKDNKGERQKQTEWHNIVCWRGLADIAEQYLRKGMQIYVEGKIRSRSWEDNGTKKYITEIIADNFQMLGAKSDSENSNTQGSNERQNHQNIPPAIEPISMDDPSTANQDDDLPF